jgi:hypothetical protein
MKRLSLLLLVWSFALPALAPAKTLLNADKSTVANPDRNSGLSNTDCRNNLAELRINWPVLETKEK